MNKPEHFELMDGYAIFRPTGMVSLQQAVQWVTSALIFAREQQIRKLLVDATGLTGFEPPSISARYFFIHEWARAAQGSVCVAMAIKPKFIDPQKFGVMVGGNAGLRSEIFASEQEALVWLQNLG